MKRLSAATYAHLLQTTAASVSTSKRSNVAAAFIQLLRRHRAMKLLPRIIEHLQQLDDAAAKRTRVMVTAATAIDGDVLAKQLTKLLGPVVLDLKVDPALRGGLVLRVGDTEIDGSIRTQLEQLHHQLTTT